MNRKLVHISVGLVFMLCWPLFRYILHDIRGFCFSYFVIFSSSILLFNTCLPCNLYANNFSSGRQGAFLAALVPGVNIIRMLLLGLGIWKDEATIKSMSRFGDYRLQALINEFFSYLTCMLESSDPLGLIKLEWGYSSVLVGLKVNLGSNWL